MQLSFSKHIAYNYITKDVNFDDLREAIKREYNITANKYREGHKTKDNWEEATDCLIFDFDLQVRIKTVQKIFNEYSYLIHTTKNHNKEKNGIVSERFRLYLPTNKITLNMWQYEFLLKQLCYMFGADIQGALCSMSFRGYKDAEFYENKGNIYCWNNFFDDIKHLQDKVVLTHNIKTNKSSFMSGDFERMFKPDEIIEGNRNRTFARYTYWARDNGCDIYEARQVLEWLNNRINTKLPEKEINSIIKGVYK